MNKKNQQLKSNRSNLIYNSKYSFYQYHKIKVFNTLSLAPKYSFLFSFYNELNKFNSLKLLKETTIKKNETVYDNASELYNEYLEIYFDQYIPLSDAEKRKLGNKHDLINLFLKTYNYYVWF